MDKVGAKPTGGSTMRVTLVWLMGPVLILAGRGLLDTSWGATAGGAGALSVDDWWSWKSLELPAIPQVMDKGWSDNPIDRFILAVLESKGMKPSAAADRRTFIRRVT